MVRPDALPGLKKTYQLQFKQVKTLMPNLMYKAIADQQVDVIMAFSTDGLIAANQLQLLVDDKHFFPPYYAAPLVRNATLKTHPELTQALAILAGSIDEKTIQDMNYQVEVEKKTPKEVVAAFYAASFESSE